MKTKKNSDTVRISICSVLLLLLVFWLIMSGIQAVSETSQNTDDKDNEEGIHSNYA